MARTANPLIGRSSGSVGGVTFSSWKGINVMKSKPVSVANPQSDKQKAQRAALAFIVAAFRSMSSAINAGFRGLAVKKSPYNAFSSDALKNAFDLSVPPTATFQPENLLISKGSIAPTTISSVVSNAGAGTVTVNYPTTSIGAGQSLTDRAIVAVYNATDNTFTGALKAATRDDGQAVLSIPAGITAEDELYVYLGFTSVDSLNQSDSVVESETV